MPKSLISYDNFLELKYSMFKLLSFCFILKGDEFFNIWELKLLLLSKKLLKLKLEDE